jgi:SAM-dependent methyltransferase
MQKLFKFFLNLIPRPVLIRLSLLLRPVIAFFLKGDRYVDPIDGRSFRRFLPYGYEKVRKNVLSPSTLSLERHRLFWLYLKKETSFFNDSFKVLHFAPEQAFYKRFRKLSNIEYVTTDLNSPIADVKADICDLPFSDNEFDFIICNHVLEHIPNDDKAMKELYRVLKNNGTAIIQVPYDKNRKETFEDDTITDPKERRRIFGQYDHVRVYGMDYFEKLRSIGFEVDALDLTASFTDEEIDRYRLAKGELIPVCKKSLP